MFVLPCFDLPHLAFSYSKLSFLDIVFNIIERKSSAQLFHNKEHQPKSPATLLGGLHTSAHTHRSWRRVSERDRLIDDVDITVLLSGENATIQTQPCGPSSVRRVAPIAKLVVSMTKV